METIGQITTIIVVIVVTLWLFASIANQFKKEEEPKLAGTIIPELEEGLDISKRYDIVYSGEHGSQFIDRLSGVRIIGYVGQDTDEVLGKMYMRSRWLVVELVGGKRAYLMPHCILSLQESMEAS